ncbi:delta 1-pyrroline-5-carboxylate synthetase [Candidatus Bathyarchaeota archaeon]|nr:delta 1-pyrroline-5-carboxylate synthetase [Candidatus Bathyarchaeota archaeon]
MKIGGSIYSDPAAFKKLCFEIGKLSSNYRLVIVPGGAVFADEVRLCYRIFHVSEEAAHKMAILAMSQYGLLIADLTPNSKPVYTIKECLEGVSKGFIPVLLPHRILEENDPFQPSWDVTSDSISAYVAHLLNVKLLILTKNVDGVYDECGRLLKTVSLDWLRRHDSCLDRFFPEIVVKLKARCFIVNGLHPERIALLLAGEKTTSTEILID